MELLLWEQIYRDWLIANQEEKELLQVEKVSNTNSLSIFTIGGI